MAFDTYASVRPCTSKMLDMMDNGEIDPRAVADMALSWLSEDSVKEMMQANDISTSDNEDDEDDDYVNDDSYDKFDESDC